MVNLNEISAQEIGRRLKIARENAGYRQDQAAQFIGFSRPTLVSIEKGERRIRIPELQQLAHHYGVSVNSLLRREAVHLDLVPRFRKLQDTESSSVVEAVGLLNNLLKAEVELENVLGIDHRQNYPDERGISSGDVLELAEQHSKDLRNWLGLGFGPIADIFSTIELGLGIRLYQRHLTSKSKVAGLFSYDASTGACILLNANHPIERRWQSAAHELGHFMSTRRIPEVLDENEQFLSRDERYASAFGRAFLTPKETFAEGFRYVTQGSNNLTRRHVILLANNYRISREACVRRLEELNLVKKGTWVWFETNGGITNLQEKEVLGSMADIPDPSKEDAAQPISQRMSLMVHAAWKQHLMSEGQLVELLKISRIELRALIDQIELEENETNGELKLLS